MKINSESSYKCKFKLSNCWMRVVIILFVLNFKSAKSDQLTVNSTISSDLISPLNSKNQKIKLSKSIKLNCPSHYSAHTSFVNFLELNISVSDFKQIINLEPNDVLYFGKKIVAEGSSLSITCIMRLNRTSQSVWHLNNAAIDQFNANRNKSKVTSYKPHHTQHYVCKNVDLVIHRLTIKKVVFMHTGEYECVKLRHDEKVRSNRKKHFVHVLVTDWEEFNLAFLPHIYYDILGQNQSIVKYCPLPSPVWYKWATRLDFDDKSIIRIHEFGRYICKSQQLNRQIDFWIFELPKIESFVVSGTSNVNGELRLECRVSIRDGGFPLPEINYFVGKSRIDTSREKFSRFEFNENAQNYPNSIVSLHNLTRDDRDVYTCKAFNQIEALRETEASELIDVIDVKKHRLNLKSHTDVDCPNAPAVDHWYFKNGKINVEVHKKYRLKNEGKTLTIVNADTEQEGEYKCEFKNRNHTIILITPPRIHLEEIENCRIDLLSVHAYEGQKFRIDCKSNNQNMKYQMRWLKDGKEIKDLNEVTNRLSLEYETLKETAKANYTCQASNEVGHFNIEFVLRVRNKNAYLLPIGGIVAELIILLSVIWWHERTKDPLLVGE